MPTIVLVGLMGTGKSTSGRLVATRLNRELIDSDTVIESDTGVTVRELWESGGEAAYRELESRIVLDSVHLDPPVVVAAPGGVVLDPSVREALKDCFVAWLRADPKLVADRVAVDDHRPLLGSDPAGVLSQMATERAGLYSSVADVAIDIDSLTPAQVAERIIDAYGNRSDRAGT